MNGRGYGGGYVELFHLGARLNKIGLLTFFRIARTGLQNRLPMDFTDISALKGTLWEFPA